MKSFLLVAVALFAGCAQTVKVAPVTVQPIHITVDVNLHDAPADAARSQQK